MDSSRLLSLPREIRDLIYMECLITQQFVDVFRLHEDLAPFHREQPLNISTGILTVCRQIHDEASDILYMHTFFYMDLHPRWEFVRPTRWWVPGTSHDGASLTCLACLSGNVHPDRAKVDRSRWKACARRIWRLYLFERPYSYLQWRYSKSGVFAQSECCPHTVHALPSDLRLSIAVISVSQPAIVLREEASRWVHWDCTIARYCDSDGIDANDWRDHLDQDLWRDVPDLLAHVERYADLVVFSCASSAPDHYERKASLNVIPRRFRTGNLLTVANSDDGDAEAMRVVDCVADAPDKLTSKKHGFMLSRCRQRGELFIDNTHAQIVRHAM